MPRNYEPKLFTLIYFVLEAYYEDEAKNDERICTVLSDMNSFLWKGTLLQIRRCIVNTVNLSEIKRLH